MLLYWEPLMVKDDAVEQDPRQKYAWYPVGCKIQSLQPISLKSMKSSSRQHSVISGRQFECLLGLFRCGNGSVWITRNGFRVCSMDTGALSWSVEQVVQAIWMEWFNRCRPIHFFTINFMSVFTQPSERKKWRFFYVQCRMPHQRSHKISWKFTENMIYSRQYIHYRLKVFVHSNFCMYFFCIPIHSILLHFFTICRIKNF